MLFKYFKTSETIGDPRVDFPMYGYDDDELDDVIKENLSVMKDIEILCLQDLIDFIKEVDEDIIIHEDTFLNHPVIEIYDTYRE